MNIAITGTSGFLGALLAEQLSKKKYNVISLNRKSSSDARVFDLTKIPRESLLDGVDFLIHCAYDMKERHPERIFTTNYLGSCRLFDLAQTKNIPTIFISTISAYENCQSVYGQCKLKIENYARERSAVVLRPGLIFSENEKNGGMYGKLEKLTKVFPVLPMVGQGIQYLCPIGRLTDIILDCLSHFENYTKKTVIVANKEPISLKELLLTIAQRHNKRVRFIPVPVSFVFMVLAVVEKLKIPFPIKKDSLVSLLTQNKLRFDDYLTK